MRADVMPGYRNCSSRRVLTLIAALAVVVLVVSGCSDSTPIPPDVPPTFSETLEDQSYTVGEAITPLELPAATGGNGELSYSLEPPIAGLVFDPVARTLSGTPQTAGSYRMTYRAVDADANTADSDAATLGFTITVEQAEPADTAPMFTRTVDDQSYTVGEAITPLELPEATGGNGELSYSLEPAVAGLVFDPVARTLSGTLRTAGTYDMTYTVADADDNSDDTDADTEEFTITVQEAPTGAECDDWNMRGFFRTATVEDVTSCIQAGADVNARDDAGRTPLHYAAQYSDDPTIVTVLVGAMAEVDARSDDGETPLHRAAQFNGNPAMVTALTESGADADAKRNDGQTPLHRAARYNENPAIVTALLSAMASVNAADDNGRTPLDVAQNPAVIAALRAAGGECGEGRTFADDTCQTDTAPRFTGMVDDRTYTAGEAIRPLVLPEAVGGNGALSYELTPEVPGLTFDRGTRTLSGTPTSVGNHNMTYRVVDSDTNSDASDADHLTFRIEVYEPQSVVDTIVTSVAVGNAIGVFRREVLPASTGGPRIQVSGSTFVINGGSFFLDIVPDQGSNLKKLLVSLGEQTFGYYDITLSDSGDLQAGTAVDKQAITKTAVYSREDAAGNSESSYQLIGQVSQDLNLSSLCVAIVAVAENDMIGPRACHDLEVVQVGTGDVQISLSWDVDSDVDLHVVDPNGDEIYWRQKTVSSGGQLDLDSNAGCQIDGVRNENVTWPAGSAPRGLYTVRVNYWSSCEVSQTNYVIRVNNGGMTSTFSGTLTGSGDRGGLGRGEVVTTFMVPPDGAGPPPARDDHGNSPSAATMLPALGAPAALTWMPGTLTEGDVDYFSVEIRRPALLEVYTRGDTDTLGRLEDATGATLAENDNIGHNTNFKLSQGVSAGTYYVRVTGSSGNTGDYTLFVYLPSDRHGDTPSTATRMSPVGFSSIAVATQSEQGTLIEGDVDYFVIDVHRSGRLDATTSGTTDTLGRLEAASGTPLDEDDDSGSGTNFRLSAPVSAGTHYVRVSSYSGSSGEYTLTVSFDPLYRPDDHGNSRSTATRVGPLGLLGQRPVTITESLTRSGTLTEGDIDYFRIQVLHSGTFRATTTGSTDTVGRLEDAAGGTLAEDNDGGNDANFELSHAVSAGDYYVRVSGFGRATGDYRLTLELRIPGTEPPPPNSVFNINYRGERDQIPGRVVAALIEARNFWENAVAGDIVDLPLGRRIASCPNSARDLVGRVIDDVVIYVLVQPINESRLLAKAGPCLSRHRSDGGFPAIGLITFNTAWVHRLTPSQLRTLAIHETAHVLGVGTHWEDRGLLRSPSRDTHFIGRRAIAAFDRIGGRGYPGNKVPAQIGGGHWRESVFGDENMTPIASGTQPVSIVTIESLGDLGYQVNASAAEPYRLSGSSSVEESEVPMNLEDDIWEGPVTVIDREGNIMAIVGFPTAVSWPSGNFVSVAD